MGAKINAMSVKVVGATFALLVIIFGLATLSDRTITIAKALVMGATAFTLLIETGLKRIGAIGQTHDIALVISLVFIAILMMAAMFSIIPGIVLPGIIAGAVGIVTAISGIWLFVELTLF